MKKIVKKLALNKQTMALLDNNDIKFVKGGSAYGTCGGASAACVGVSGATDPVFGGGDSSLAPGNLRETTLSAGRQACYCTGMGTIPNQNNTLGKQHTCFRC